MTSDVLADVLRRLPAGAIDLARHAAVPVALDARFLNLVRVNFFLDPPAALPYEAEAALLLSPLFREIGEGLYEIYPSWRNALLSELLTRFGRERLERVAVLLEQYTDRTTAWHALPELENAQRLTALSLLDPARADDWLQQEKAAEARPGAALSRSWFVAMEDRLQQHRAALRPGPTAPTRGVTMAILTQHHVDAAIVAAELDDVVVGPPGRSLSYQLGAVASPDRSDRQHRVVLASRFGSAAPDAVVGELVDDFPDLSCLIMAGVLGDVDASPGVVIVSTGIVMPNDPDSYVGGVDDALLTAATGAGWPADPRRAFGNGKQRSVQPMVLARREESGRRELTLRVVDNEAPGIAVAAVERGLSWFVVKGAYDARTEPSGSGSRSELAREAAAVCVRALLSFTPFVGTRREEPPPPGPDRSSGFPFSVLGDLELRTPGGELLDLPRGHDGAVLAALLIWPNRQVSSSELKMAGWGTQDISVAQLHRSVSALRKLLAEAGRPRAIRTHNRFGYELAVADDELDILVFHRLVERADADRAARRTTDEIASLRQALRLWRGPQPFANVAQPNRLPPSADSFRDAVHALKRRRKRIAVRLFALENARGEHAAILDDLEQFAAEDPTDAQLCRHLMIALYLSGHPADATGAYERHAAALDEATAGRPDTNLRALHFAMLNHDDEAVVRAAGTGESTESTTRRVSAPRQLPAAPAAFVGRSDLLAEISWLLHRPTAPVAVISGPGGIGKTALALRAAHDAVADYPDGQLWAELRGTTDRPADPAQVLAQFLRALGVPVVPDHRDERAALFRSLLADRRVLMVLDDAAGGAQIRDLIPAGGTCAVLVTARRRLPGLPWDVHHVAPVPPLDHATSTELFRGIVTAANVDVRGEEQAIDEIVQLCGGLPLALRIAAALRVEDFHRPTADLVRRLTEQGPAAFEYGDASLTRTLDAGLAPLDDRARRLFLCLGLLTLPAFGEWTAAALLDDPGPAGADALHQLAAASMIEPVSAGVRYRFHDLTREYARSRAAELQPAHEREEALGRVGRALLTLTRQAHAALCGGDYEVAHSGLPDVPVAPASLDEATRTPMEWFDRERVNIRATVEMTAALGLADVCWDLAVSAHEFYTIGGYFDDWRATHAVALFACRQAGDRRGQGVVLSSLGQPALVASGTPGVSDVRELETAVRLLDEAGEPHGRAIALRTLANALRRRGEVTRPLALFTEALADYESCGDLVGSMRALQFIGQTQLDLGDADGALATLQRAQDVAVGLDRPRLLPPIRYWTGRAHLARGDLTAAEAAFREVIAAPDAGAGHAYAVHGLADHALAAGDVDAARRHLTEAERHARDGADAVLEGRISLSIAALEAAQGHGMEEIVALLRAVAMFQSCRSIGLEIDAQAALAAVQARAGHHEAAEAAWDRIDELYAAATVPPQDRRHHRP